MLSAFLSADLYLIGYVKIFILCCSSSLLFLLSAGSWVRWQGKWGEQEEKHRQS